MTEPSPDQIPTEDLEREICEYAAHMAAGMCRWLLMVGEFNRRQGWAAQGMYSCAHWLSWRCSIGLRAAREQVRVAGRLPDLPLVVDAFSTGELSYSKVRAITRVATPDNEEQLVMLARSASGSQLERIVSGFERAVRATVEAANTAHEKRSLWVFDRNDGMVDIHARIPAEDAAVLIAAIDQAEREARVDADGSAEAWPAPQDRPVEGGSAEHPIQENRAQRRADALVEIARRQLDVEMVVHVDIETLTAETVVDRAEVEGGAALPPETMRRLGCDAGVVPMIERNGKPLSVGRRTRTVPPAIKRALRERDRCCRFPGCHHNTYLHAHHIQHWVRGGHTSLDNLVHLCTFHHRLVHEGGYAVQPAGRGRLQFRRPDGHVVTDVPPPTRARGPGVCEQNRARGIEIDEWTAKGLEAYDTCDYGMAVDGLMWRHEHASQAEPEPTEPEPAEREQGDPPPDPPDPPAEE
jgi:hypothetical protein